MLRWFGGFAVVAYLLVWASAVPLFFFFESLPAAGHRHSIPDSMLMPALLTAAGGEARPVRVVWLRSLLREDASPLSPLQRACIARLDEDPAEALEQDDGYYDLVMIEDLRCFSEEAERGMIRELLKRTRQGGLMVLPFDMMRHLPRPSAEIPYLLPGGNGAGFIAVSPDAGQFPDTDPEELERRLRILGGDEYWPHGIYPAVYPLPGRRIVPLPNHSDKPLHGKPLRALPLVTIAAALLWLLVRLVLARRESVAWILRRGENAAAFALALLLAAQMSCRLELWIGSTPWDILPLIPLFWIGGGMFFRGRAVAWAALAAAAALFCFLREDWLTAGMGYAFFGLLILTVLVAASERRLLRKECPLSFRNAFFAESGGFVVACGLWLLLRDQPFSGQLIGLGVPAVIFRLAACRSLF